MFLTNKTGFQTLERTLDASTLRQKVIANNIANVDTPNFKRSEVHFEEFLTKAMQPTSYLEGRRTNAKHLFFSTGNHPALPQIRTDQHAVMNNNLNNVDIDNEMAIMAKNQLRYNVMIQQVNHELRLTKKAIEGR